MRKYLLLGVLIGLLPLLIAGNFSMGGSSPLAGVASVVDGVAIFDSSVDIEGDIDVSGNGKFNTVQIVSYFTISNRSEAALKAISPTDVGQLFYDETNNQVVVSTGTDPGSYGLITDGSTPTGW